jgi:hypothetical protein
MSQSGPSGNFFVGKRSIGSMNEAFAFFLGIEGSA